MIEFPKHNLIISWGFLSNSFPCIV